ncbi:MAG TPA: 2-oxoacid:acceptor oxidoreductase family protein [Ignavibacteriaceae bacterium]|nr:2-oxoacid:acceptor oxidoreductase family protein [Ignavibacteriaceae bacterium]
MEKAHEIIFAGFGGQGILSMGQIISYAAMIEEKEVSWMPSYGPEMRGGTANCTVIVSGSRISSPIVSTYDSAIVLNQPSLDKFEKCVKKGGLLIYEESSIINPPTRDDIEVISIPANEEALKLNMKKVANMILVGAFLEKRPLVKAENILKALKKVLPERHHHLIPVNEKALTIGKQIVSEGVKV